MVRFGVIGYGCRGASVTGQVLFNMEDVCVTAVCDEYADRTEKASNDVFSRYGKRPYASVNYMDILNCGDVDAVYIATSWETHNEIAIEAMKKHIPVALEVGGAYNIESLWELVHTYEETKTPFMFMENCCFDKYELLATSMVRKGIFGEIVYCHGAYGHYLCDEIAGGDKNRHYRLRNYLNRNAENYPTHELGPIAKILDINRGNRMVSLVSVASKACGMNEFLKAHPNEYPELNGKTFMQGDIVDTIITCADGSTISLRLDTTLPRYYSREFTIRGTCGLFDSSTEPIRVFSGLYDYSPTIDEKQLKTYEEKHLPSVWKNITPEEMASGHGGMDAIEFRVFVDCLTENKDMPIDIYDAAAWMCITVLSEKSIAMGSMPQQIPDFTNGKWQTRKSEDVIKLC